MVQSMTNQAQVRTMAILVRALVLMGSTPPQAQVPSRTLPAQVKKETVPALAVLPQVPRTGNLHQLPGVAMMLKKVPHPMQLLVLQEVQLHLQLEMAPVAGIFCRVLLFPCA
jgi:hypothetical protein